jgi:uncharacterized membrane-anchored protein YitT (DUF2179 family)
MIALIRKSKYVRYFWTVIGIYVLNISVDVTDNFYNDHKQRVALNNQESIIEIIVEKVLGYENAITEKDSPETEKGFTLKKFKPLEYIVNNPKESSTLFYSEASSQKLHMFISLNIKETFIGQHYPPPEL